MSYKLMATDFDLTLSRTDRSVSERTRSTIAQCDRTGKFVTLATGRLPLGAEQHRHLFHAAPMILCNGAILQDPNTGEILMEKMTDGESALQLLKWLADYPGASVLWSKEGCFSNRLNSITERYTEITGIVPRRLEDPGETVAKGVYKLFYMCREEELQSVRSAYLADPIPGLAGFCSSSVMLEFMRNDADKGTGLAALAARLGIAREEVIAIGDGENDIPMLRWAGLGVAMANAPDDVKAAADLIAPHCDEDGCAQIMEKYLLNE